MEQIHEQLLRGKAGISHIEVDAHGYVKRTTLPELSQNMEPGKDLKISINIDLQAYIANLTKEQRCSVVLMNVHNGLINAMTSTPSFDPNLFLSGIDNSAWQNLINNPAKPLVNKAVSSQYPPGSTFKIAVALAALEHGFNPEQKINCKGKIKLGRRWFHCWKEEGHGQINLPEAIAQSCNCYFYKMGHEVGIDKISNMAYELGLGAKTSNNFYNEKTGNIPTKKWKKQRFNQNWVLGDTYNSSIGQGYVEVTNIQLAVMMARIITAKKITPTITSDNKQHFTELNFKAKHIALILKSMFNVVNDKTGTAYYSKLSNNDYHLCGKTGTAQVIAIDHNKQEEDVAFNKQNHGLFVGFAPYHQPKYAISIIVEHGKSGSASAAPIAKKIFLNLCLKKSSLVVTYTGFRTRVASVKGLCPNH